MDVMVGSDTNTIGGMVAAVNSVLLNTRAPVFFHLVTVSPEMEHVAAWLLQYHPHIMMEVSVARVSSSLQTMALTPSSLSLLYPSARQLAVTYTQPFL